MHIHCYHDWHYYPTRNFCLGEKLGEGGLLLPLSFGSYRYRCQLFQFCQEIPLFSCPSQCFSYFPVFSRICWCINILVCTEWYSQQDKLLCLKCNVISIILLSITLATNDIHNWVGLIFISGYTSLSQIFTYGYFVIFHKAWPFQGPEVSTQSGNGQTLCKVVI